MKIAVTGATGHIGLNLVAKLTELGHEVRALYDQPKHKKLLQPWNVACMQIDVCNPETLNNAFKGCDIVIHLAGIISIDGDKGGRVHAINAVGTKNVAEAALKQNVKRMVHTSSIHAVTPFPKDQIVNEERPLAISKHHTAYDRSKAQGELYLQQVIKDGLDAVIVRPVGVIGPKDHAGSLTSQALLAFFNNAMKVTIAGGFNWIHVSDVVDMLIAAAHKGETGEAYIIAGQWHSIKSLAEMIEKITGSTAPSFVCPIWLAKVFLPIQRIWWSLLQTAPLYTQESLNTLSDYRQIDDSKARKQLGHQPQPVESALYDLFVWLQKSARIDSSITINPIYSDEINDSNV
ncbi:MAG: NAD-dependent epimerase/dehydratase family protein [Gammaproteobacteria bacterium]|nr:NAD-dependent epimerase/dehydratase family protein [Gammaproteobacteria bacterium]MCH9743581.1 NAD-dependent epimerase/dehydratase family protein [Gammaproteobacteria bacterium]